MSTAELERAAGMDVSNHLEISGSYTQFEPRVPRGRGGIFMDQVDFFVWTLRDVGTI